MLHHRPEDDPAVFAQKLWREFAHTAQVHAAVHAWDAINNHDLKRCKYWKEVFAELDRLEDIQTSHH